MANYFMDPSGNFSEQGGAMDPLTLSLLFGAGSSMFGSFLSANAASNQNKLAAQQFEEQRGDTRQQAIAQFLSGIYQQDEATRAQQAAQGLNATQLNPYKHSMDLNKANVMRSFAAGYQPGKGFSGTYDMSALSPDNLQGNADYFYKNAAAAQPNVDLTGRGSGSAEDFRNAYLKSVDAKKNALYSNIMNFLQTIGSPNNKMTLPTPSPYTERGK